MTFGPVGIRCPDHAGAAGASERADCGRAPRVALPLPVRPVRHVHAHRDQRRRLPPRAPARGHAQRNGQLDLRARRSRLASVRLQRPARRCRRGRMVATHHRDVPPRRLAAPRDEHARPLVHRTRARGLLRPRAVPASVRRLRARRLRGRARLVAERGHRRSVRSDLGAHGRCAHSRVRARSTFSAGRRSDWSSSTWHSRFSSPESREVGTSAGSSAVRLRRSSSSHFGETPPSRRSPSPGSAC